MDWKLKYPSAYLIGSLAGILNEMLVSKSARQKHLVNPNMNDFLTASVFNIYGWSTVALTGFLDIAVKKYNINPVLVVGSGGLLITLIECIGGQISLKYHKKRMWCYNKKYYIPFARGYCSVVSSAYFTFLVFLYYLFYKKVMI